jgi:hypothetical protein
MKKIIIVVIVLAILIGAGTYLLGKKSNEKISEPVVTETSTEEKLTDENPLVVTASGEDSAAEVFKYQPGAIKTITNQKDDKWLLAVDLLTKNPNYRPGGETDYFINQNNKVRNLLVTNETKTYECNGVNADALRNTSKFMSDIQVNMIKRDEEAKKFGTKAYDYTSYFDINGTEITAIYQQCLP